jgi:hypothetical protein
MARIVLNASGKTQGVKGVRGQGAAHGLWCAREWVQYLAVSSLPQNKGLAFIIFHSKKDKLFCTYYTQK